MLRLVSLRKLRPYRIELACGRRKYFADKVGLSVLLRPLITANGDSFSFVYNRPNSGFSLSYLADLYASFYVDKYNTAYDNAIMRLSFIYGALVSPGNRESNVSESVAETPNVALLY